MENRNVSMNSTDGQNLPLQVGGISKKNRRAGGHSTYLKACINNRECECLLDTGCEASIVPADLVNKVDVKATTHSLKAANGTSIPLLSDITLPMRVGEFETTITVLVSEHIAEVMLGIDWLSVNKIVWNFDQSKIKIGNQYNITQSSTEPTTARSGVHVSGTVIPDNKLNEIPVRIMNTTNEEVELKKGTVLSELQPVTVTEDVRSEATKMMSVKEVETTIDDVPRVLQKLIDNVDASVPESTVLAMKGLLLSYRDAFSKSELDLGITSIVKHRIDTGNAQPFRQPLRRFPPAHVEAISEHVDNMIAQGILEPACSPYASNIVLVKKKDNTYR